LVRKASRLEDGGGQRFTGVGKRDPDLVLGLLGATEHVARQAER
jgi:hypothetical protein